MNSLYALTHRESGAVYFPDTGQIIICYWADIEGVPRFFRGHLTGLGEEFNNPRRVAAPKEVKKAMRAYEKEQGAKASRTGFKAWRVNDCIVVTQNDWN